MAREDWAPGEEVDNTELNQLGVEVNAKYVKPVGGIPESDLAAAVQTKLNLSGGGGGGGALPKQSVMGLGDSLIAYMSPYSATLGGDSHMGAVGGHSPLDYVFLGNLLANSAMDVIGSVAESSKTADYIRTNFLPTVKTVRPGYCIVHSAGANDILVAGEVSPLTFDITEDIFTQLRSVGTTPIVCTLPPAVNATTSATVSQSEISRYNAFVSNYAYKFDCPLLDFYEALVDPATGDYKAGYSTDHVHPNESGAAVMAERVRDLFLKLANTWTRHSLACVNTAITGQMTNPLLTDGGSGVPTGWSVGAAVSTSIAASTQFPGNELTMTAGASMGYLNLPTLSVAAGAEWDLALRLQTVPSGGGGWGFGISNGTTDIMRIGSTSAPNPTAVPANTVCHLRGKVPAATTTLYPYIWVHGSGSILRAGQVTLRNLSASGMNIF